MIELDEAFSIATVILSEAEQNIENIRSEEDTKIQIITRLLCEAMGWSTADISAETHHENGFSDYILSTNKKPAILIEAKRISKIDISTAETSKVRYLKLSGPGLKKCMDGIDQAFSYAAPNGLSLSVLTDGIGWIIFKTFPGDGPFKTKEAIVFPSFEAIKNDFSLFYDILSKPQFNKKVYNQVFDKVHGNRVFLSQNLVPALPEHKVNISKKSELAYDLGRIFSQFFAQLTGDNDDELLIECFVETRESRIADFSLEKMTASVLGNIVSKDKSVDDELSALIARNIDSESGNIASGQTVFIVGATGAGKSTFLDRFFKRTLSRALRSKCVLVRINCLDSTGSEKLALSWLTEKIIHSLETEIYKDGIPTYEELQGLYFSEYQRRLKGADAYLYESNKDAFKLKFGEYLNEVVEKDREGYLRKVLSDVVQNRARLPIFVLDNTDEFTPNFKVQLFQFLQSLNRHAKHCLIIFPVTDKSAWMFSKTDIYSIYKSKSFFLPTPSPREVFRKRIDFLKGKLSDKMALSDKKSYFSNRGIRISISNLSAFAGVLENIFVDHDYTSKTIGELTNYNIRRTLLLSQRVITSSVFKIDDLIKSFLTGDLVATNFSKFMDALLRGDYQAYKAGDNPEIFPIFQSDSEIKQSPLLKLRVLALLDTTRKSSTSIDDRHLESTSITNYFDAIGATESSIDRALLELLESGLIEPYDTSERSLSSEQRLAISFRGTAHLRLATRNSVFFYQMALTTATTSEELAAQILTAYNSKTPFPEKVATVRGLFLDYLISEDMKFISTSLTSEQYENQNEMLLDLNKFRSLNNKEFSDPETILGDEFKIGTKKKKVTASVEWFNTTKGYGFVEVDGQQDSAFLFVDVLKEHSLEKLDDGDDIVCDITRTHKGWTVEKIHKVITDTEELEEIQCEIIRIFEERGYGFVRLLGGERDALFHLSIVPNECLEKIKVGEKFDVRVYQEQSKKGWRVKEFTNI